MYLLLGLFAMPKKQYNYAPVGAHYGSARPGVGVSCNLINRTHKGCLL